MKQMAQSAAAVTQKFFVYELDAKTRHTPANSVCCCLVSWFVPLRQRHFGAKRLRAPSAATDTKFLIPSLAQARL